MHCHFSLFNQNISSLLPLGALIIIIFSGYENFVTLNQPLFSTGIGLYRQTVTTSLLPEGMNFLSVLAFRQRASGTEAGSDPLHNEWRKAIWVDTLPPPVTLVANNITCLTGTGTLQVRNPDGTAARLHYFVNLAEGAPIPTLTIGNQAITYDRLDWLVPLTSLPRGANSVTVVAVESPDGVNELNRSVTRFAFTVGPALPGDVNDSGGVDVQDLYALEQLTAQVCEGDIDADGDVDNADRRLLESQLRTGEPGDVDER